MTERPDWQKFEKDANAKLGLDATVTSGSKWYDKNDGTTRGHPLDNIFMLDADEKSTKHRAYSLSVDFLESNRRRSVLAGKTFVLPVRFELESHDSDWVVLNLEDFTSLVGIDEVNAFKHKSDDLDAKVKEMKERMHQIQNDMADLADESDSISFKARLYDFIDTIDDVLKAF